MKHTELKLPEMEEYLTQEAFNDLRTNIQFCGQTVKVIAVTSCSMNEGKVLSLFTSAEVFRKLASVCL